MVSRPVALKQLSMIESFVVGRAPRLAAQGWSEEWQTLISIVLSARTRDDVTIRVCEGLFKKYKTANSLSRASLPALETSIHSVNFFRNKARSVSGCAKMLVEDFDGRVPHEFDKLLLLSGVGRKTANVFLSEMGVSAIGVDTHVFQIARFLGWSKSSTPEGVEKDLKALFLRKEWSRINESLVSFGQLHRSRKKWVEVLNTVKKCAPMKKLVFRSRNL